MSQMCRNIRRERVRPESWSATLPNGRNAQCLTCGEPFDVITVHRTTGEVLAECGHDVREQLTEP